MVRPWPVPRRERKISPLKASREAKKGWGQKQQHSSLKEKAKKDEIHCSSSFLLGSKTFLLPPPPISSLLFLEVAARHRSNKTMAKEERRRRRSSMVVGVGRHFGWVPSEYAHI